MSITALLELNFSSEVLDQARDVMRRVLDETRNFEGCNGIEVLVDVDNKTRWTIVERWESEEHDQTYREFRSGTGKITELGPLLTAPPQLTKFTTDESL
ncbi:hypothetical protein Rruber_05339 (plasmid) [Rhodococcus ruber]|uniref:putative quinol monooxygenase n=1 Tax=Rhodococcus ruber TaxID=1830 RepID=UPI00315C8809